MVVAIIALLLSILLPTLRNARMQAKIVVVHADLRQVCTALDAYLMDNRDRLPPTRMGCALGVECQLPAELAKERYLNPPPVDVRTPQAWFPDLFQPAHTYRYRAPGAVWYNGEFYDFPDQPYRPRSWIWVPEDFPHCESEEMQCYRKLRDEPPCPVVYAVWSVGPDLDSPKFPRIDGAQVDESRFPLPKAYWLHGSGDTGLITHFRSSRGPLYTSP